MRRIREKQRFTLNLIHDLHDFLDLDKHYLDKE
jgi:hypothetical protein